jgi:very-short-patch-repair endonuclease
MTPAESILWKRLRNRRCHGFKFRRQQVIEGFVADFYCEVAQLVIEIDGAIHDDPTVSENDAHREEVFKARGIATIRFPNRQVYSDIESVLNTIAMACIKSKRHSALTIWESAYTSPLPSGEGNEG